MPYKHRQSVKSNDKQVRDMIFMGYVVVYRVNEPKNRIEIIEIDTCNALWANLLALLFIKFLHYDIHVFFVVLMN